MWCHPESGVLLHSALHQSPAGASQERQRQPEAEPRDNLPLVQGQKPPPGTVVKIGSTVTLYVKGN
jgi:beta-lactam-binding protein with PASTA domain